MKSIVIGIVVSLMVSLSASGDFVTNGSFEAGTPTSTSVAGDATVTDWTKINNSNVALLHVNSEVNSNGGSFFPDALSGKGMYYAAIYANYLNGVYLYFSQAMGTLEIGKSYRISGYVNNDNSSFNSDWQVRIGGEVKAWATQNKTWQSFSFEYTANVTDGTTPTLYLGYYNTSANGSRSSVLYDEVTVVPYTLLLNGSFDDGTETNTYASGDATVTRWSKSGGGSNLAMYHVNSAGSGYFPAAVSGNGTYYTALSANWLTGYRSINQILGTLEIGRSYRVTGYVNNDTVSANCDWEVKIGDTVVGSGTLDHTWQSFSFDYLANATDGTTPTLKLGYQDTSSGGSGAGVLYDEVTVVIIPPPEGTVIIIK